MKYSLGLDIGVASVGWAVIDLEKERIHDLGVRIFDRAEDPQDGTSLSLPRRTARSARRRLKRRRQRLNNLKRFFVDQNILTKEKVDEILDPRSAYNQLDVYELRTKALKKELSAEELFKVFYQISKRRGFKSNRKVVEESDKEGGRVSKALKVNEKLLKDGGYKTAGEALQKDEACQVHKRNKRDDYSNSFARQDFISELEKIIEKQRTFTLKNISDNDLNNLVYGLDGAELTNINAIMYQRPFMTPELIQKMVGNCTFESDEKRAPRASYSFELFRLVSDLSHLVYIPKTPGSSIKSINLNPEQIENVVTVAKKGGKLTYKKVREAAGISDAYKPNYVRGKIAEDDPYGEKNDFGNFKAYHNIRLALKNLPEDWAKVDNEEMLNKIAYILTTQKADEAIEKDLSNLPISDEAKKVILKIKPANFKSFGYLSIKALQKITPHILSGMTYDKACAEAGYDFKKKGLNLEQITNPVVKRAVLQTIKVVNAVEQKYGQPYFIKIETARELAKDFDERRQIEKDQKENQVRNQSIIETLKENGVINPTGQQIIKVKLYREQNGKCMYSGKAIDFAIMLQDDNAYQVDHIVPFSRSGNDGMANKALVLTEENQLKGDKTPFEYMSGDEKCWKEFIARVEATYKTKDVKTTDKSANRDNYKYNGYAFKKKNNLLVENYKNEGWSERALNDTRYITRFMQNYLRQAVDFAPSENRQRVFAPSGIITGYLRKRWGLTKIREEDVLHHAQDAAVVAVVDQSLIQRANMRAKKDEVRRYLQAAKTMQEKTDLLTGEIIDEDVFSQAQVERNVLEVLSDDQFPQPWTGFAKEVKKRTLAVDTETLQNELRGLENYDEEFRSQVKPIFVSRMAKRKTTGQAHKETIRSPKVKDGDQRTVRTPLSKIKRKDVENSVLAESDKWLYKKLLALLDGNGDDPKKAFAEPVYKNDKSHDKNGKPIAPVSTIKVYSTQPSGFFINNGKAFVNNGSMVRLDVYKKKNAKDKVEHFFVPVYAHQVGSNRPKPTKILPAPKGFTDVDETFTKVCSLYPNDYVQIKFSDERIEHGYYVMFGIASGQMVLVNHLSAGKSQDKLNSISPRSAMSIQKIKINILGDNAPTR